MVYSLWPKSQDKNLNILTTKRAIKMKWKAFFVTCRWFPLTQLNHFFWKERMWLSVITSKTNSLPEDKTQ